MKETSAIALIKHEHEFLLPEIRSKSCLFLESIRTNNLQFEPHISQIFIDASIALAHMTTKDANNRIRLKNEFDIDLLLRVTYDFGVHFYVFIFRSSAEFLEKNPRNKKYNKFWPESTT